MRKIFFYGLFMDRSLLLEKGLRPKIIGAAVLAGYRIHIGARATVRRSASSRVYGIVMELPEHEARALYAEPSVRAYVCERVQVALLDENEEIDADCYILPLDADRGGSNKGYATALSRLAEKLQFDAAYVEEIKVFRTRS